MKMADQPAVRVMTLVKQEENPDLRKGQEGSEDGMFGQERDYGLLCDRPSNEQATRVGGSIVSIESKTS